MKRILLLTIVAVVLSLNGCVTTHFLKRVEVHKDPQGNVTKTVMIEEVVQPNRNASALDFDYLKISD